MMLGPAGVVQLWPADKQLVIGEGLETVLAAATRLPYRGEPLRPAWAMLSDGALARFPVIDGVERLILLADNDLFGRARPLRTNASDAGSRPAAAASGSRPIAPAPTSTTSFSKAWNAHHERVYRGRVRARSPRRRHHGGHSDTTANANRRHRKQREQRKRKHRGEHRRRGHAPATTTGRRSAPPPITASPAKS